VEIERKFLVGELPPAHASAPSARLRQGYLLVAPEGSARLRDADGARTLTVKSGSGLVRSEHEITITRDQFEALWPATAGRRLEKRRYRMPAGDLTFEVDVFEGDLRGLVLVEVEFESEAAATAFVPPVWFGTEVTDDPAYTNASLATRGRAADEAASR
jgi:CYTH domain-containing protein